MSKPKLYIEIKGDTNDADYVTERTEITEAELIKLQPVFDAIKAKGKYRHNWNTSDYCDDESPHEMYPMLSEKLIETFSGYCPSGECGIHTIESIKILKAEETKIL